MGRVPLDTLVQIVHAGKTDAVLREHPWQEHTHHVTSENGWATTTTLLQLTATLDGVLNPGREGQAWILLWDMARIHASEATLAAMKAAFPHVVLAFFPPLSTSYLQPCDVAVFRSFKSCIQAQASATLARSVIDGSFEGLAMNKAWRRQSSAEWAARAVKDLCDENKAWTTGWRPLRAHSDAHFKEAVEEAAALHAHDGLFSKHIELESAPEDPVDWVMAEASDDEDDAPMPDAPPEPVLIDMPPAPASAPRMSNLERCIALRRVYGPGWCLPKKKSPPASHHIVLSVVSRVRCPVCRVSLLSHVCVVPCVCVLCPARLPDSDKKVSFFFRDGLKMC